MRWRLVAVFVGITLVVLAAHDIPLAQHLRRVERDRIVTGLERDAFVLAGRAEDSLSDGTATDDAALQSLLDAYRAASGARVVVTDGVGDAVAISDEEVTATTEFATRVEIATALTGTPVDGERASTTLGFRLLYVAVPVISGSSVVGTVRITYPAQEVSDRVSERVKGLLVVALISVLTAAGAATVLAGTLTRPLRRLRAATERLGAGSTTTAPTDEGPPEIRGLAEAFNSMAARITRLVDAQRGFAGDASHQLRTPLTALRLRLDQASEMISTDPEGARLRIESASAETERLQHLVDGLLALARAEGRDDERRPVDVAAVAAERVEVWRSLAEEQSVTLDLAAPAAAMARTVPGAVEQIIDNFIDNALTATPAGGSIEVVVELHRPSSTKLDAPARHEAAPSHIDVHVLDSGPGMPAEHLEQAFDRFWRSAGAAGAAASGSGLGLAIVAQLAQASGATAWLGNRPGGGLDAAVRFVADPQTGAGGS